MIYGIVDGDVIANVIEAVSLEDALAVAGEAEVVPDVARGWVWTDDGWAAPVSPHRRRELSGLEFELLVQSAAGLTDADVLTLVDDPALRLFWLRLNKAAAIEPGHEIVAQGLDALVTLGHITEAQRQAVLGAWPVA